MRVPRSLLLAAAALALLAGRTPSARADRLGGNYRGPDAVRESRGEEPPPAEGDPDAPPPEGETGKPPPDAPPPPDTGGDRGPAGESPTDGRPPSDPPAPEPGSGAPPAAPPAPAPGVGGKPGKSEVHDDGRRIWPFYFESAKEEYLAAALARRAEPRLAPPRTSSWMLSIQPEPSSPRRPVFASDRDAAFRLVLGRLRDPDSRVRDAAVIALGKSGREEAVPYLRMAADRDRDPAVREDALIALGLTGDREEALPALLAALDPAPSGKPSRRAACASLGLGLLGDPAAAAPLRALLEGAADDPARAEEAACAATALGMLHDGGSLPLFARILESRGAPDAVKCLVLHAIGRLGAHPSAEVRRTALEVLRPALDRRPEIRQSALLALGSFADPAVATPLLLRGILDPDPSCRNGAAHSLGRISGRAGPSAPGYASAARELARYADGDHRDRFLFQSGNLALAAMACAEREKDLLRLLAESKDLNLHSASSVVISLGMLGADSEEASRGLRAAYAGTAAGSDVRAYAGLAMAMADAPGSAGTLAKALTSSTPPDAAVARTTALALGLIGGAAEADVLVDVLRGKAGGDRRGGDRTFLLGAAVQGLGIIADGDTVGKLEPLLGAGEPWTTRAFATAALGYLLERDPARRVSPRISEIFRHRNLGVALPLVRAVESTL